MNKELAAWIRGRPGPFSGRTHDAVWEMAWRNFCAGPTGGFDNELLFAVHLQEAGYGVRALKIGGFTMDEVT